MKTFLKDLLNPEASPSSTSFICFFGGIAGIIALLVAGALQNETLFESGKVLFAGGAVGKLGQKFLSNVFHEKEGGK